MSFTSFRLRTRRITRSWRCPRRGLRSTRPASEEWPGARWYELQRPRRSLHPLPGEASVRPASCTSACMLKPLTSSSCRWSAAEAAALRAWLAAHGFQFRDVPYAQFAAEKEKTNLVYYESGKLVVQGKGTQEFVEFVLEPEIL